MKGGSVMQEFFHQLEVLTRAYTPLVYIQTLEPAVLEERLRIICWNLDFTFAVWKINDGLTYFKCPERRQRASESQKNTIEDAIDPIAAVNHIAGKASEKTLYLLFHFHSFLNEPTVCQFLVDFPSLAGRQSVLFIASSRSPEAIPTELRHLFIALNQPLPSREEIAHLLSMGRACNQSDSDETGNSPLLQREGPGERLVKSAQGLTALQVTNAIASALADSGTVSPADFHRAKAQLAQSTNGALRFCDTQESWERVGGLDRLKAWFLERKVGFSEEAKAFGVRPPKGVLLTGVPGTGKTLVAKAVASLLDLPFVIFDFAKVYGAVVSASEENLSRCLSVLEAIAPCVCLIDEIEKGLAGVESSNLSDGGTTARVVGYFLSWLQDRQAEVFIVATANNIRQLPPELLRKGRFDAIWFLDLPTFDERLEIFNIHIEQRGRNAADFDLDMLAEATEGYTGAEIEALLNDALYRAFNSSAELNDAFILQVIRESTPLSVTRQEDIQFIRDWAKERARPASSPKPKRDKLNKNGKILTMHRAKRIATNLTDLNSA
jgi:hypothetical protein